jgi:eukaryotic-like serine/threonine-protein kinase
MELNAGQKLQNGKYTIERELGRGRFAITYLAKKSDESRQVIKILDPQVLSALTPQESNRYEENFWKEAVILAKCNNSSHIVKGYTPFKEGTITCLPMEYIDGNSLADRTDRILEEKLALKYIRQIGEALAVVHSHQLVHCDIRPANIFLRSRSGVQEAVLADFGLSLDFDAMLTRTRRRERVDGFSAPELYTQDRPMGAYTDIYSLSATLYDLLTGETPVGVIQRNGKVLESPQIKNHHISAATAKTILKGTELAPEKRPKTVTEWLEKLPSLSAESALPHQNNWNWQTFWMAMAVLVSFLVGVPAWLTLTSIYQPKSNPSPSSTPIHNGK